MSTISSTLPLQAGSPYQPLRATQGIAAQRAPAAPSAVVTLSAQGQAAAADATPKPASTAMRYRDLGAELLGGFGAGAVGAADAAIPKDVDNRFALGVVTASGRKVDLVLANVGEAMFVRVDADPELGGDERAALAGLAKGFQDAIDGMALDTPRIRLGELARFSHPLLQSIELRAEVTLPGEPPERQSLALRIDADRRSLAIDGPRGAISLAIDTSRPELLGTRQQQSRAIDIYLQEFDQAARRGHGDPGLATMFRDAFADLSRTSSRDAPELGAPVGGGTPLSTVDRAVLTGMADFEATIAATPRQDNPARREEITGFRYAVSQATRIEEKDARRSLFQVQTSQLKAQFHEALDKRDLPAFDFRSETQNYRYHEIDDSASSAVSLDYRDGRLLGARLEQSLSESERVRKYVLGRLMADDTTPARYALVRDLMATLAPYQPGQAGRPDAASEERRDEQRQASFDALGEELVLLGSRLELAERDARL